MDRAEKIKSEIEFTNSLLIHMNLKCFGLCLLSFIFLFLVKWITDSFDISSFQKIVILFICFSFLFVVVYLISDVDEMIRLNNKLKRLNINYSDNCESLYESVVPKEE